MRAMVLAALLASSAGAARADDVEQAKMMFNAGAQAFAAGQFQAAVQAFQSAYKLSPRPAILFSTAQAERRQYFLDKRRETIEAAIRDYRAYIDKVQKGGRVADAAQALSELEPMMAKLEAAPSPSAPPPQLAPPTRLMVMVETKDAEVWVDGKKAAELPYAEEVKPGKHSVRVTAPGYFEDTREVTALPGNLLPLDVTLRERPALLVVRAPEGSLISIDGRPLGLAPMAGPAEVPPGTHLVTVTRNGFRAVSREIELPRGGATGLDVPLHTTGQRVVSNVFLVAGAVSVVAGGVFTGLALHQQGVARDVLSARETQNIPPGDVGRYEDAVNARDMDRRLAFVGAGAGAAFLVTGVVLHAFDQPSPATSTAPLSDRPRGVVPAAPRPTDSMDAAFAPLVGPSTWGAAVRGTF